MRRLDESRVYLGLINPKSPANVGAVMRAAGCFGVAGVYYTGQRYARAARFQTDTKNAGLRIPLTGVASISEILPQGTRLVCVELVVGATPLPQFRHPEQAFYLFGPEDGNLTQELIDRADAVVYVPTAGCLNLAAAVNIVLYDRAAKADQSRFGKSLILESRDRNNRLKMRAE